MLTPYFFACFESWTNQNQIKQLTSDTGQILTTSREVEAEIMGFYKQLLGTCAPQLPVVLPVVMQNGYTLSREQQLNLIQPFTKDEMYQALQGIDDQKAPGCDGYNAHFLRRLGPVLEVRLLKQ